MDAIINWSQIRNLHISKIRFLFPVSFTIKHKVGIAETGRKYNVRICYAGRPSLEAKDVLRNINRTQAAERADKYCFVPDDPELWPLTLTFKVVRARNQTRLSCEFDSNPFSRSQDIWGTSKQSHSAKKRTLRSSLRAVIILVVGAKRPNHLRTPHQSVSRNKFIQCRSLAGDSHRAELSALRTLKPAVLRDRTFLRSKNIRPTCCVVTVTSSRNTSATEINTKSYLP